MYIWLLLETWQLVSLCLKVSNIQIHYGIFPIFIARWFLSTRSHSQTHACRQLLPLARQAGCRVSFITGIRARALRTASYAQNVSSPLSESETRMHVYTHLIYTLERTHLCMHASLHSYNHIHTLFVCVCSRIALHMKHSCTVVLFSWGSNRISSPLCTVLPAGHTLLHTHSCT